MVKNKFVSDYQINASKKIIFPYLSTASGLGEWFADNVTIDHNKTFHIDYDGTDHYARIVSIRTNHLVKFEFFDPEIENEDDNSYVEFKLEENELTQTIFLKIIDYSDGYEEDELEKIWEGLIANLKEIIGG
ncbi:START-like domain-containing protein [Echinicola pacifica]|nr:START-like domain-containing protein [Echinicola pacifica]